MKILPKIIIIVFLVALICVGASVVFVGTTLKHKLNFNNMLQLMNEEKYNADIRTPIVYHIPLPSRYPSITSIDEGIILPPPPPNAVPLFWDSDGENVSIPTALLVDPKGFAITRPLTTIEILDSFGLLLNKKKFKTILIEDASKVYRKEYPDFAIEVYLYLNDSDLLQYSIIILEPNNELIKINNISETAPNDEKIIDSVKEVLEAVHYLPDALQHLWPLITNKRQLILATFSKRRQDKNNIIRRLIIISPDDENMSSANVENYTVNHNFIEYYIVPGDKVHYEGKSPTEEIATRLHDKVEKIRYRVRPPSVGIAARLHTYFVVYLYDEPYENINNKEIFVNWDQVNLLY
ncbi:MAG: hypothetical protein LBT31_04595 [Synergistaceae bacterium]|jgi:hypothetical protein|nr:hypothetical protein [Synergistaceae bacterium]